MRLHHIQILVLMLLLLFLHVVVEARCFSIKKSPEIIGGN
jgi:hypothetical protein